MGELIEDVIAAAFCAFVGMAAVATFWLTVWWLGELMQIAWVGL